MTTHLRHRIWCCMKGKSVFVFYSILIVSFIVVMSFSFPVFLNTAIASENELVVGIPEDRCPLFYIDKDTGETVGNKTLCGQRGTRKKL